MRKKITLFLSSVFILVGCVKLNKQKTKEEKFWIWFSKNQEKYLQGLDDLKLREPLLDELSFELSKINRDLAFEFSPITKKGTREMTITAQGIEELFVIVESLMDKAPVIDKWKFNTFRQRVLGDDFSIQYGEFKVSYSDVYFKFQDGDYGKLGIQLHIKNYNSNPYLKNAVYILLDNLIGEYDTTKGIDWIDWVELDDSNIDNLTPLVRLRSLIDSKK